MKDSDRPENGRSRRLRERPVYDPRSVVRRTGGLKFGPNSGKNYVQVRLNDAALPYPPYAQLGRVTDQDDNDMTALIWERGIQTPQGRFLPILMLAKRHAGRFTLSLAMEMQPDHSSKFVWAGAWAHIEKTR